MHAMTDGEAKRALRRRCREIRNKETPEYRAASDEGIFRHVCAIRPFQASGLVLAFISAGGEPETRRIIEKALSDKKTVAVPLCDARSCTMEFYAIDSFAALRPGVYGIPEPNPARCHRVEADAGFCLVPALGFDRFGMRLGHGKGYYDRFLSRFHGVTAGLCRENLLFSESLPAGPQDVRVQWVVTEKRTIAVCPDTV